ncbi:AbrB/MazE/SpoVT family DNA-binding domain-containing protein [Niallia oryzisoli]|uniref:AbrB/MazE/SpoVT family DNA-binding domain-containing protein n=1 Tax=Niallia oryzisoli TaxID=1737571 RepID=UPI0037363CEC
MVFINKLLKTGQVRIPIKAQRILGFKEGQNLFIYHSQGKIFIVRKHDNYTLNQCIFRNGRISIPAEIRRLLRISPDALLEMQVNHGKDKLIIKNVEQGFLKKVSI